MYADALRNADDVMYYYTQGILILSVTDIDLNRLISKNHWIGDVLALFSCVGSIAFFVSSRLAGDAPRNKEIRHKNENLSRDQSCDGGWNNLAIVLCLHFTLQCVLTCAIYV